MSCNGCRVLRKGCSDTCILRPCLQWIEGAEAQGNATVFVAKFFGRAGLMNFISAVPENQRPALFQSLLYEACGRTVNPVFGAVGLLWCGNWHINQLAVEAVLKGNSLQPFISGLKPTQGEMPLNGTVLFLQQQLLVVNNSEAEQQQQHQDSDAKLGIKSMQQTVGRKREASSELVAPVPQRVRSQQRPGNYKFGALAQVDEQADLDLDLTLYFHAPSLKQQPEQHSTVNSPCNSMNSEGSVTTSVETGDLKISL